MATGDVVWFNSALKGVGDKVHNLGSDTLKVGIIKGTSAPTAATADPRWGAGGSTDFSTDEVATGSEYSGPVALTNVSWTDVGGNGVLKADNIEIYQDNTGFTDAQYAILYNDTAAGKPAIGFIDARTKANGPRSLQDGPFKIEWNVNGILRIRQP